MGCANHPAFENPTADLFLATFTLNLPMLSKINAMETITPI